MLNKYSFIAVLLFFTAQLYGQYTGHTSPQHYTYASLQEVAEPIPKDYTGFKIQLFTTYEAIDIDDMIFVFFEKITFEQTLEEGFIYTFGDFNSKQKAIDFLQTILFDYPAAKVVSYQDGLRVVGNTEQFPLHFFDIWNP